MKGAVMKKLTIITILCFALIIIGGVSYAQEGSVVYYSSGGAKVAKGIVKALKRCIPASRLRPLSAEPVN